MFSDALKVKALLFSFVGYLVASVVATGIVVQAWLPAGVTDPQELSRLAEADAHLLLWQIILGTALGIVAGFAACQFSGAAGLKNSLVLGLLFLPYAVLGIYMHPSHPLLMQASKLVAPIPLSLLGGWLRLAVSRSTVASHA